MSSERFLELDARRKAALRSRLSAYLSQGRPEGYLESAEGRADLDDHLSRRLRNDRRRVVPWLDAARPLRGSRVLEIGCGTGSSTVSLAEQGARVTAVDVDRAAVEVARERCASHGVEARFVVANAGQIAAKLAGAGFDWVIFYASLEHMTHGERLAAMTATWEALPSGGLWCVTDTPNRLWWLDDHTSRLPFFMWLPDELAFQYSSRSPRPYFREIYRDWNDEQRLHFLRRGRGVSYHELDLALGPAESLDVVSCLRSFHAARRPLAGLRGWRRRATLEGRYEALLAAMRPDLHRGFLRRSLDLIVRKP